VKTGMPRDDVKDATKNDIKEAAVTRRALLRSAAWTAVAASPATAAIAAWADTAYPSRPVTWVVPYAAGGAAGRMSRLICPRLAARLGQPFVLDYRPGAGGIHGTQTVAAAAPDGYTLLATTTVNPISAALNPSSPDAMRQITPIAGLARTPMLLLIHKDLPVRTLAEFVAYARNNPGKLSIGSAGPDTVQHLSAELFRTMAGVKWTHVPYRGSGPALVDLSSGHVHAIFDNVAAAQELLRNGSIRAIAVTTRERLATMPELPPVSDVLPGFETMGFYGVAAPRGTPQDVIDMLNREINAALADPAINADFADMGAIPLRGNVHDYNATYAAEITRWRKFTTLTAARKDD
jgi:tripartite-type tricarboxylate transporter receptor subunit TctC